MRYENARWTRFGGIDCNIEHPVLGWIPYTAVKDDVVPFSRMLFEELATSANVAPCNLDDYPLPPADVLSS
jgi:hypothetical protein